MSDQPSPELHLIAACASNRVIGRDGRLPWHLPEDLSWFDGWTRNRTLLLGRICYETWPQVHLHGRRPIVVTSRPLAELRRPRLPDDGHPPLLARSTAEALRLAGSLPGPVLVCGGSRLFEACLPLASRLLLTEIHSEVLGDTYFPSWNAAEWRYLHRLSSRNFEYRYTFSILERRVQHPQGPSL